MKIFENLKSKFAVPLVLGLLLILITITFSRLYLEIFSAQKLSSFEKQNISEIANRNTIELSYKLSQLEAEYNTSCIQGKYNETTFFVGSAVELGACEPGFFSIKKTLSVGNSNQLVIDFLFLLPIELKFGFFVFLLLEIFIIIAVAYAASKYEKDRADGYLLFNTLAKRAAHDIRGPLTAMNSLLYNYSRTNEPASEILGSTIQSLNSIAEDLLTFHKISNFRGLDKTPNTIEKMISQILSEKQAVLTGIKKKIAFTFNYDSQTFLNRPIELYRIFSNIIQNSIDAIESEGFVRVELNKGENEIMIEIADNGSGIPESVLKNLGEFEFSTKQNGNGLGLYYAKKTVVSFEGSFNIVSIEGEGTKIRIQIPLKNLTP